MGRFNKSPIALHDQLRSEYASTRDSRFRKRRSTSAYGTSGDAHLPANKYFQMLEYARAMDRDDPILGSILDRAEINTLQDGLTLDFDTGDVALDQDLIGDWNEWASKPVDIAEELTFADFESAMFRASQVDGDTWALLLDDQKIQVFEAHRIRTPDDRQVRGRNIVQGVELSPVRKQLNAFITQDDLGTSIYDLPLAKFRQQPVWDEDGLRVFLQINAGPCPRRTTLTRGVSIYQKLFDLSGMLDDSEFAAILKQQLQNALVMTEEWEAGDTGPAAPMGPQEINQVPTAEGTYAETIEGFSAGTVIRSKNGRKLKPFVNNAPGPEFVPHVKHILSVMGVNLGMPLVLVLMDASETNFSGWRGAFDQAKMGFRRNQSRLIRRCHDPVLAWRLAWRRRQDVALDKALTKVMLQARKAGKTWYTWHAPSWPYVNPMEDVQANLISVANYQEAPSTNAARNGRDYDREMQRGIEDRGRSIEWAMVEAKRLNERFPDADPPVRWTDLYTPLQPKHVTLSISDKRDDSQMAQPAPAKTPAKGTK